MSAKDSSVRPPMNGPSFSQTFSILSRVSPIWRCAAALIWASSALGPNLRGFMYANRKYWKQVWRVLECCHSRYSSMRARAWSSFGYQWSSIWWRRAKYRNIATLSANLKSLSTMAGTVLNGFTVSRYSSVRCKAVWLPTNMNTELPDRIVQLTFSQCYLLLFEWYVGQTKKHVNRPWWLWHQIIVKFHWHSWHFAR